MSGALAGKYIALLALTTVPPAASKVPLFPAATNRYRPLLKASSGSRLLLKVRTISVTLSLDDWLDAGQCDRRRVDRNEQRIAGEPPDKCADRGCPWGDPVREARRRKRRHPGVADAHVTMLVRF